MSYKWHHNFPKIAREAGFMIREISIGHCIDWRFVASIDPYSIVNEQDYEKLDEFIPHISEVPIGTVLNNRILDPAIGKYFVLAQFSIQYLFFCKQFLDETLVEIRNSLQGLQNENVRLEKINKKRHEEMVVLQKKLQRAESINQLHAQQPTVYACTMCTKNFISPELLNTHMGRKHPNYRLLENSYERKLSNEDTSLINTIKLELEVKQLKERLNVAEKDLLGHQSKHHRCEACSVNNNDRQKESKINSIGIQSNLIDGRVSIGKEAQTQTESPSNKSPDETNLIPSDTHVKPVLQECAVSKSDLQFLMEEQKQLFEYWKDGERDKFTEEIKAIKQNLVDAVRMMEKNERISPLPACDDGVWKQRYQELVRLSEHSQKHTRDTMATFENTYMDKLNHLETLLSEMLHPERKENLPENIAVKVIESLSPKSSNLRKVTLPSIVIEREEAEGTAIDVGLIDEGNAHKRKDPSDSEGTQSDEELPMLEVAKVPRRKTSPQIVMEAPQVKNKESSKIQSTVLLLSPKKQILSNFRVSLKMMGVDDKSKQLTNEGLNNACEALAVRHNVLKKKHNNFFITRNQILSKVDEIARAKVGEPSNTWLKDAQLLEEKSRFKKNPIFSVRSSLPPSVTCLNSSPTLGLQTAKQKIQSIGMTSVQIKDINICKPKPATTTCASPVSSPIIKLTGDDIITVHADIATVTSNVLYPSPRDPIPTKPPSILNYDTDVEALLDTPMKTVKPTRIISGKRLEGSVGDRNSDIREMLDAVPAHPKPIPKKRVLFDLDNTGQPNVNGASSNIVLNRIEQRSKLEEESDWNISSFDEDK